MSGKKSGYRIKSKLKADVFELPVKLVSKLSDMGENELKIFLTLAMLEKSEGSADEEKLISALDEYGIEKSGISEVFAFLRGAGLIEKVTLKAEEVKEEPKKEHKPTSRITYTSKELAEAVTKSDFKAVVEYASRRLGKTFNTSELATLYSFKEYLSLPCDVIMLGIEHCVNEGKGSLRYIEKLLIDFADKEINTYQKVEAYIKKREDYLSFEGQIRKMMGLGTRTLTSKETTFIGQWQVWEVSSELIKLAYDKTVEKTGKVSMNYMHKIIESWHTSGFKTVSEVEIGDKKPTSESSTFDPEEFFKAAVEKSMR